MGMGRVAPGGTIMNRRMLWALAAVFGLSALVTASEVAYEVMRVAGAALRSSTAAGASGATSSSRTAPMTCRRW